MLTNSLVSSRTGENMTNCNGVKVELCINVFYACK